MLLLGLVLVLAALWFRQLTPRKETRDSIHLINDADLESVRQFERVLKNFYKNDTVTALFLDTLWLNTKIEPQIRDPFAFATPRPNEKARLPKQHASPTQPKSKPTNVKPAVRPVFKLAGIIYERQRPHAIINATVVQVGDTLAGYRIVEITPSTVQLVGELGTFTLTLPEEK